MQINREKINYAKLKESIILGCDAYLKSLENPKLLASMSGFFHSDTGRTRANKMFLNVHMIKDDDVSALLCFSIALFKTSSKGLTTSIAEQVFKGRHGIFEQHVQGIAFEIPIYTLSSDVFSLEVLEAVVSVSGNFGSYASESVLKALVDNDIFNKRSGMSWILDNICLDQNEKNQVDCYLDYLNDDNDMSVMMERKNDNPLLISNFIS